jgi:hypothetical protein
LLKLREDKAKEARHDPHCDHQAGSAVSGPAAQVAGQATSSVGDPTAYFTDMLFRTDHQPAQSESSSSPTEAARIIAKGSLAGDMPLADKTYLAHLVAARTGLSQADAEKRVTDVFQQATAAKSQAEDAAKKAADAAKKTGVYVALWAFISLLVGAFSASYMATVGGRDLCLLAHSALSQYQLAKIAFALTACTH